MNDEASGAHWSFWAIGIVTLIYNVAGSVNFFAQMNADTVAAMPEMYRAIIVGRPVWATGAFAVAVFGGALGCLLLLLRKSAANYLFSASLLGAMVTMSHTLGVTGTGIGPMIGNIVQLLVTVFLIWYSKWSERRSWLN